MKKTTIWMVLPPVVACIFAPRVARAQSCPSPNSNISACTNTYNTSTNINGDYEGFYAIWGGDDSTGVGIVGVGGFSYAAVGVQGQASTSGAAGVYGVVGSSFQPADVPVHGVGAGVVGVSSENYGVYAYSSSADGVYGEVNSSTGVGTVGFNNGSGYGVYAYSASGVASKSYAPNGDGAYGLSGHAASAGVSGHHNAAGYGVYGETADTSYAGVKGENNGSGGYGVWGVGDGSSAGTGVYGTGYTGGAFHGAATGLWGSTNTAGVGVYGYNPSSLTGAWAGYFAGNFYYTGTFTSTSDERLKKNIEPLVGALEKLLKLKGVNYEWKEPEKHRSGPQMGFIAQDVEKAFPNWVHEDMDGFKGVDITQVEALEVESIRALKLENDHLKVRADKAEAEITALQTS